MFEFIVLVIGVFMAISLAEIAHELGSLNKKLDE